MDQPKKGGHSGASGDDSQAETLGYSDSPGEVLHLLKRLLVEGVVDPATLAAIGEQPHILERLEVKGKSGLAGLKHARKIADALLTVGQLIQDPKTRLIGKSMEEAGRTLAVSNGGVRSCHRSLAELGWAHGGHRIASLDYDRMTRS